MKIAICDSNNKDIIRLKNIITSHKRQYPGIDLYTYYNVEHMVASCKIKNYKFEILFFNLNEKKMDVLYNYKKLLKLLGKPLIILTSKNIDDAIIGYEVGAFRFILKPYNEQILNKYFLAAISELYSSDKKYAINVKASILTFDPYDLLYLESEKRRVYAVTSNERVCFYSKLIQEEKKLKNFGFIRVHQGFLVNMVHIKKINKNEIILNNGSIIPISKSKKKEVLHNYYRYLDEIKVNTAITY